MPIQSLTTRSPGLPLKIDCNSSLAAEKIEKHRWYVVYTLQNREACAQAHLEDQGFVTFIPKFAKYIKHARKQTKVLAPLFSRYLFIRLDLCRDRWRSVYGTIGVASMITHDAQPSAVVSGVVESLIACCDGGEGYRFPDLRPGQGVRVLSGPFAEKLGTLERLGSADRVRVLLEIMNCQVAVDLRKNLVAPSEGTNSKRSNV